MSASAFFYSLQPPSTLLSKTVIMSKVPAEISGPVELWEDDLVGKIHNEYDPMIPNNYEMIVKQRRAEERSEVSTPHYTCVKCVCG